MYWAISFLFKDLARAFCVILSAYTEQTLPTHRILVLSGSYRQYHSNCKSHREHT